MSDNLATAAFGDKRNPRQLLIDALSKIDSADAAVLVWRDKDGMIQTGWSDGNLTERLGILEIAKLQMIEAAREWAQRPAVGVIGGIAGKGARRSSTARQPSRSMR